MAVALALTLFAGLSLAHFGVPLLILAGMAAYCLFDWYRGHDRTLEHAGARRADPVSDHDLLDSVTQLCRDSAIIVPDVFVSPERPMPEFAPRGARAAFLGIIWLIMLYLCFLVLAAGRASATPASAPQPNGGCAEAWQAPHSDGAQWCRDHGWTVTWKIAVNPRSVVRANRLPACRYKDGPNLPCYWDAQHRGNHRGASFWASTSRRVHYVWLTSPVVNGWRWVTVEERRKWSVSGSCVIRYGIIRCPDASAVQTDPVKRGVHVVGDSITAGVHSAVLSPDRRPHGWSGDGFPGRRVTALGEDYVPPTTDYLPAVRHMFTPSRYRAETVVIGLGTNGADTDMSVEEATALYSEGVARLRTSLSPKRVVLIMPWKDPSITEGAVSPRTGVPYAPYQWAEKGTTYRQAILAVAASDPAVCVMRWDTYISAHPGQLKDGIHPNATGQEAWKSLLFRTIRSC